LTGAFNSFTFASIRTILQEETPGMFLGRAAAIISVAASVGFATGALLTGLGQDRVAWLMTIAGLIMALIGIVSRWWFNYVRDTEASSMARVPEYSSANVGESTALS
jgi:MFS family permease